MQSGTFAVKAQFQLLEGSISHEPEPSEAGNPAVRTSEWNFKAGTIVFPPAGQSFPYRVSTPFWQGRYFKRYCTPFTADKPAGAAQVIVQVPVPLEGPTHGLGLRLTEIGVRTGTVAFTAY